MLAFGFYSWSPWYAERRSPMGPPEIADRLYAARREAVYCFPRNVDSVAFYTDRSDLKSCRTQVSQELVEALIQRDRTVVLFTHRHSLDTFKQVLPPQLKVVEASRCGLGAAGERARPAPRGRPVGAVPRGGHRWRAGGGQTAPAVARLEAIAVGI